MKLILNHFVHLQPFTAASWVLLIEIKKYRNKVVLKAWCLYQFHKICQMV